MGGARRRATGDRDENINRAQLRFDLGDIGIHGLDLGQVPRHGGGGAALRGDGRRGGSGGGLVDIGSSNQAAFGCQALGDGAAQPAAASQNQRDASVQTQIHSFVPPADMRH